MPRNKKDPSKGPSIVVRPELPVAPPPATVIAPAYPLTVESPRAMPAKTEECRTQWSVNVDFLGFGKLKLAFARLFRRES